MVDKKRQFIRLKVGLCLRHALKRQLRGKPTFHFIGEEPKMNRCGWLVLFVLILAALPGNAHTWTINISGQDQKIDGDFLKVVGGRVLLSVGGNRTTYQVRQLSPGDRNYVKQQTDLQTKAQQRWEVRTWNSQGQTPRARLMDVEDRKVVVLLINGETWRGSFDKFSVEDKEYIRKEMTDRGEGNKLPPVRPGRGGRAIAQAKPKPPTSNTPNNNIAAGAVNTTANSPTVEKPAPPGQGAPQANSTRGEGHIWTSSKDGKKFGRLLTVSQGKVVVEADKTVWTTPFDKLIPADQERVRTEMTARGEGGKVPAATQPPPEGTQLAQATQSPTPQAPTKPRPKKPSQPKPPPTAAAQIAAALQQSAAKDTAAMQQSLAAKSAAPGPPGKRKVCSACGYVLPDSCKAGDRCPNPNCGVYFHYEDTDQGRISTSSPLATLGIPALIASLIYAGAVGIVWLRWHSRRN